MIDEDWLEQLRFELSDGVSVNGLLGVGSANVVLSGVTSDGTEIAIRSPRSQLGFHIQEIPPTFTDRPLYDVGRVNEKLAALVGHARFDTYSLWYDRLYAKLVKIISNHGIGGVILSNQTADSVESLPMILASLPMHRRLDEIAYWPTDPDDALTLMPIVNGEEYGVTAYVLDGVVPWAKEALDRLDDMIGYADYAQPKKLLDNPLVIWSAAALEGFFDSSDELDQVAAFIKARFGDLVGRDDTWALISQVQMLANLCVQYHAQCPVQKMVDLCAKCGFIFDVVGLDGDVVARARR